MDRLNSHIGEPHTASRRMFRIAVFVVLSFGIYLSSAGYIDIPIEKLGMGRISDSNEEYLEESFNKSVNGFLILSAIKSGLAIVEGSEIGIGFNLELGDIVQSVYDYVDIAWKTALAGGTVILLTGLVLEAVGIIDHWCLALSLIAMLIFFIAKWFFPTWSRMIRISKEVTFFMVLACVIFYLVFPFSISGAAYLSEKITQPLIRQSEAQFESIKEELTVESINRRLFPEDLHEEESWFPGTGYKQKLEAAAARIQELARYVKDKTKNMAIWTLQLVAGYLFDGIIFPVTFFVLLFVVTKSALLFMFDERRTYAFKEDIAALVEKLYERDRHVSAPRKQRFRTTRRILTKEDRSIDS
jgi:hypothetical protein